MDFGIFESTARMSEKDGKHSVAEGKLLTLNSDSVAEYLPLIDTYDGTSSLNKFLLGFEDIASHCKWDEPERILALKLKLSGQARDYFYSQRDLMSCKVFKNVVKKLRERFDRPVSIATCISRLTSAYQLPSEDARSFFSRLEGLSYSCIPEDNSDISEGYRLQLLLSAAKQGLSYDILKGVVSSGLDSYDEFKKQALLFEETLLLPRRNVGMTAACAGTDSESGLTLEKLQAQIETLTNTVAALQSCSQQERPATSNEFRFSNRENSDSYRYRARYCTRCGRTGHVVADCFAPFCHYCRRCGHTDENCWRAERHRGDANRKVSDHLN